MFLGDVHSEEEEDVETTGTLRRLESEFLDSSYQPPSLEGSLFSEVHTNEIKKFERMLEEADTQKHQLVQRLSDTQGLLDKTQAELDKQTTKVERIFSELNNINIEDDSDVTNDPELSHLKQLIKSKVSNIDLNGLNNEVIRMKELLKTFQDKTVLYQEDHDILSRLLKEFHSNYNQTQDELSTVSEDLASIYHHISLINGQTPDRVILSHIQPAEQESSTRIDQLKDKLHNMNDILREIKSVECGRLLETVKDQLKFLKQAIDTAIENRNFVHKQQEYSDNSGEQPTSLMTSAQELQDLQDQIVKLKSLLSTKREQIASLRTVLKTNKQTAEVALANLKSKYETEKVVVTETMNKLRNELKVSRNNSYDGVHGDKN